MKIREPHWIVFGLVLTVLLWKMIAQFIGVLVYGLFIYYISRRAYSWLLLRLESAWAAAFVSLIIIILPLMIIITYTIGVAAVELKQLLVVLNLSSTQIIKRLVGTSTAAFETIAPQDIFNVARENAEAGKTLYKLGIAALGVIFKLLLAFIVAFYILLDGSRLRNWFVGTFFKDERKLVSQYFDDIDHSFYRVFFGNILTAGFTAVVGAITFSFLNIIAPHPALKLPYPVLLGILCGIANLIPMIGMKLVWVPVGLYVLFQMYVLNLFPVIWFLLLFLILVNILVDIFPDLILRPYIAGDGMHKGIMFFSFILGTWTFGFVGIFIGPIIVIVSSNFVKTILPEIRGVKS
ncbi:MAG: AI-2E family transporter [Candidatus Altiarchaeota archaeon]